MSAGASPHRLVAVILDEGSIGNSNADIEHERAVAIYDLVEQNSFTPVGHPGGPYALHLRMTENRLVFDVRLADGTPVIAHFLSLTPLRRYPDSRRPASVRSAHVGSAALTAAS